MNPASSAIAALENFMSSGRKLEPLTEFSDDVMFVDSVSFKDNVTIDDQTFTPTELKDALNAGIASLPLSGGTMTGVLTLASGGIGADSLTFDAATVKSRLQTAALPLTGGTLTGVLTLASDGISTDNQTYTANQLKTALTAANNALPLAGGTMTGVLTLERPLGTETALSMKIGTATTNITANQVKGLGDGYLPLTGGTLSGATTINSTLQLSGTNVFQIGPANQWNSGKIANALSTTGNLEICGITSTSYATRKIIMYENVTIAGSVANSSGTLTTGGNATIGGTLTLGSTGIIADGQTFSALQVKTALSTAGGSLPLTGGTLTGTLTASAGFSAPGGFYTSTKSNQAIGNVDFSFADMGSPPTGMYCFSINRAGVTWPGGEDNFAIGFYYSNKQSIASLTVDHSSNLSVGLTSGVIRITNNIASASYTIKANRLI